MSNTPLKIWIYLNRAIKFQFITVKNSVFRDNFQQGHFSTGKGQRSKRIQESCWKMTPRHNLTAYGLNFQRWKSTAGFLLSFHHKNNICLSYKLYICYTHILSVKYLLHSVSFSYGIENSALRLFLLTIFH